MKKIPLRKNIKPRPVTLDSLLNGESGTLLRLDLPKATRGSLGVMGFHPGRSIRLVRRAPLGDPMEVEILGYRLAIRSSEAGRIYVKQERKRKRP